jgi:cytochrome c5
MLKYIARIVAVSSLTVGTTMVLAQSGADLYKSKCQMCHAADGSGNTPAGKSSKVRPFNSPDVMKLSDDDLIKITKSGKGKMPAYGGKLTDDQITAVVAHIHTLQK